MEQPHTQNDVAGLVVTATVVVQPEKTSPPTSILQTSSPESQPAAPPPKKIQGVLQGEPPVAEPVTSSQATPVSSLSFGVVALATTVDAAAVTTTAAAVAVAVDLSKETPNDVNKDAEEDAGTPGTGSAATVPTPPPNTTATATTATAPTTTTTTTAVRPYRSILKPVRSNPPPMLDQISSISETSTASLGTSSFLNALTSAAATTNNGGSSTSSNTNTNYTNNNSCNSGANFQALLAIAEASNLVYALHTFVATLEGQVCVLKGDSLQLLDDSNSYWWLVRCVKTEEVGYIPAENIEVSGAVWRGAEQMCCP